MGLDITIYEQEPVICPCCGAIVKYDYVDEVLSGGRDWYDFLEKIGYYVPYEKQTKANNWYGVDMFLSENKIAVLKDFLKNHDVYYVEQRLAHQQNTNIVAQSAVLLRNEIRTKFKGELTMAEYIEREATLEKAEYDGNYRLVVPADTVKSLPAADVVPRPRWIPVVEYLPEPETEVMIVCNRNGYRFIATAIHEDGTLLTEDSSWNWNDVWAYGRYDEEHDDYFIPEGWWENRCFTPDDVYNCPVDCEVTHWMPMPELPKGENNG